MAKMKNPFARMRDPHTRAALEYLSQLDEQGKRLLVCSIRGFVMGYAPHNTTAKVIPFVARASQPAQREGGAA